MPVPLIQAAAITNWDQFLEVLSTNGLKIGQHLLAALGILLVGWWLARWFSRMMRRLMLRSKAEPAVASFLSDVIYALALVFVVVSALGLIGFDTTSFAAVIAAGGLAIGLALQGSLANLASGILLLTFKPFRTGDSVEIGTSVGTIEEVRVFSTLLRTADNVRIYIPNNQVAQGVIKNYSANEQRRIELMVNCSYDDSLPAIKQALEKVVRVDSRVSSDPQPSVTVNDFAPSGVQLAVRAWVRTADFADVRAVLVERIKLDFDEHKFKFAYRV